MFAEHNKPTINVCIIGHVDHGKTTLTAALTSICAEDFGGQAKSFSEIDDASQEKARGITYNTAHVKYETDRLCFEHVDCPRHADYVKLMITGATRFEAAILVCSAADGAISQTREQILLARECGVSNIVVFLNKMDTVNQSQADEAVVEVQNLLSASQYTAVPFIRGSALMVLNGQDDDQLGASAVRELLKAMENTFPVPPKAEAGDFLMAVEDIFDVKGRGTVARGRIERGVVNVDDEVEIVGLRETKKTTCTGFEVSRQMLDQAKAGYNAGLLLAGLQPQDIERGQVLAKPGSIKPHKKFTARIYVLSKEEDGRHTPFFNGHRPLFYFRTTGVTGTIELPSDVEMVMPGDNVELKVELIKSIAMETGLHFTIREGGRTVGRGVVSEIND
ncbi:elongation factor Tu [Pseudomonas sp. EA_5y_Pfl2_R50]|uniref:elongation factor Tu n=1 Tax=Pseudomonas sp. EA_5y_Pfl2_R50 TaxID=3088691 RepID=UPI0030DC3AA1